MTTHEKQTNLQQQVSIDIATKVKAIGKYHSGCGEKVIKIKDEDMMLKLATTVNGERKLHAVSIDGFYDAEYDKYGFYTLSVEDLVSLVEYINEL